MSSQKWMEKLQNNTSKQTDINHISSMYILRS